jgi:hypothetical protein
MEPRLGVAMIPGVGEKRSDEDGGHPMNPRQPRDVLGTHRIAQGLAAALVVEPRLGVAVIPGVGEKRSDEAAAGICVRRRRVGARWGGEPSISLRAHLR